MSRTDLPWGVGVGMRTIQVLAGDRRIVIGPDTEAEDLAAFIVRAANSHYELVEACREALSYVNALMQDLSGDGWEENHLRTQLRAALAKAGAE